MGYWDPIWLVGAILALNTQMDWARKRKQISCLCKAGFVWKYWLFFFQFFQRIYDNVKLALDWVKISLFENVFGVVWLNISQIRYSAVHNITCRWIPFDNISCTRFKMERTPHTPCIYNRAMKKQQMWKIYLPFFQVVLKFLLCMQKTIAGTASTVKYWNEKSSVISGLCYHRCGHR